MEVAGEHLIIFFTLGILRELMRLLLPTGTATEQVVIDAAQGYDADVVVTGEIASFLTPHQLEKLVGKKKYDMVIVSGMCTASFTGVEQATGVPVFRGPRHAADLSLLLPLLGTVTLSRTVPADDFLAAKRAEEARASVAAGEEEATFDYLIRRMKIGGTSRMKVLAEIMDAHRRENIREDVERFFASGADIVDLGFGFDAAPADVTRVFGAVADIDRPLAVDSQDAGLIRAALPRADIVLSLHSGNIPVVGKEVAEAGAAAVIIADDHTLAHNITLAKKAGVRCIIADPLLRPAGSGLVASIREFKKGRYPLFFGAGNVVELLDADSPGMNALLAAVAMELGASVIFTSEHSDKTQGSVAEMRRATEMMALAKDRPYPKDLGIDLLVLKEKRRRREPPLEYGTIVPAKEIPQEIQYDPKGNFRIGIEGGRIVAVIHGRAVAGTRWQDAFYTILKNGDVSLLDHAAYLGRELYKAELAIRYGRSFEQDGEF
jgi:dihydropteroate synthase-like protein